MHANIGFPHQIALLDMLWAFSHVSICELSLQPGVKVPLTLGADSAQLR
jgi:hypothetical protein